MTPHRELEEQPEVKTAREEGLGLHREVHEVQRGDHAVQMTEQKEEDQKEVVQLGQDEGFSFAVENKHQDLLLLLHAVLYFFRHFS